MDTSFVSEYLINRHHMCEACDLNGNNLYDNGLFRKNNDDYDYDNVCPEEEDDEDDIYIYGYKKRDEKPRCEEETHRSNSWVRKREKFLYTL